MGAGVMGRLLVLTTLAVLAGSLRDVWAEPPLPEAVVDPGRPAPPGWRDAWRWSHFDERDGLPSRVMKSMLEDRDGTVWVGTGAGLCRYDGFRFHVEAGLPREEVYCLARDPQGGLWCAIGLSLYRHRPAGWTRVALPHRTLEPRAVHCDDQGRLLVGLFDPELRRLQRIVSADPRVDVPTWQDVEAPFEPLRPALLLKARDGVVGLGCRQGGFLRRGGRWERVLPATKGPPAFTCMAQDPDGALHLGSERIDGTMIVHRVIEGYGVESVALAVSSRAKSITMGPAGLGVAISRNGQVFTRDPDDSWHRVNNVPQSLQLVQAVHYRGNGDLWVLSRLGLRLCRLSEARWLRSNPPDGSIDWRIVNALAPHPRDGVWAGCGGGVAHVDRTGRWLALPAIDGMRHPGVTGLAQHGASLWACSGSRFEGLRRWDGKRWHAITRSAAGERLGLFHAIVQDPSGDLLFPEFAPDREDAMGAGGRVFRLVAGQVVRDPRFRMLDGLRIYDLAATDDGTWWVATARGVRRIVDGRMERARAEGGRPMRGRCFALCPLPEGGVLTAHQVDGLAAVASDGAQRALPVVTRDFPQVWGLCRDGAERIWVTTGDGLACRTQEGWIRIAEGEGLEDQEFWPVHVDQEFVWLGARGGGVWRLTLSALEGPGPRVEIDSPAPDMEQTVIRWEGYAPEGRTRREYLQYRYRLADGPWSPWSLAREVVLPHQGPGAHEVRVQARGALGRLGPVAVHRWDVPIPLHFRPLVVVPIALLCLGFVALLVMRLRRRKAARAFEAKVQESQRLESLGLLAGGVAHDFNNLLTTILANASMGLRRVPDDSDAARHFSQIEVGALHAAELTNQMLVYSGRGRLAMERVDLNALVRELGQLLSASLGPTPGLQFVHDAEDTAVLGDPAQLRQVIMNLIVNAGEASRADSAPIEVSVRKKWIGRALLETARIRAEDKAGIHVCFRVADHGVGMDEGVQQKLFDPFFTTKATGRGLGLSAVAGIVKSHGGALFLESRPGAGTVIEVVLPEAPPARERTPVPETEATVPVGGKILVVDDDASVRFVIGRALEEAGFEVAEAGDGVDGLARWRAMPTAFRIVLVDCTMPRLDGAGMTKAIRVEDPDQLVVAMSGYDASDMLHRFGETRPDAFLRKPFRPDELVDRIREVLGQA